MSRLPNSLPAVCQVAVNDAGIGSSAPLPGPKATKEEKDHSTRVSTQPNNAKFAKRSAVAIRA